jgi:hypothetical protein
LEQSYIIVFDTTIPKGNTISEKVLNLAQAVIPELTREYASYADPLDLGYDETSNYLYIKK